MGWNLNDQKSGQSSNKEWIAEGNIEILVFKEETISIYPLVKSIDLDKIAEENRITKNEAHELVNTELYKHEWYLPFPMWEHVVPSIPGKRFFTTIPCQGIQNSCKCCEENESAKLRGIEENKLLPYPFRKRYIIPVYVHNYNKVLYMKQNQDYFEDMSKYLDKHGFESDFDIWKTGKGFNTKYKSMYGGPTKFIPDMISGIKILKPSEIDFTMDSAEISKKLGSVSVNIDYSNNDIIQNNMSNNNVKNAIGEFIIPFGTHKGKSIKQIDLEGGINYLNFMLTNSTGVIQKEVALYLESKK